MAKILIILILVYFFYIYPFVLYWSNQMEDIWKLKFVFGKMGVGKTGLIAKMSLLDLKDPRIKKVYTSIGVPGTYKFNPEDLKVGYTFEPYSSVYIDEFGLIANSRDFKSFPKELRKWFKFLRQSRCKVTIFSQAPDIDKSVRDLCHEYSLLRRVGPFVFEFDVSKNIDVGEDQDGNGQLVDNYFKTGILGGMHIHYLPRYFGLWKSFDPPKWDYIQSSYVPITPHYNVAANIKKFARYDLMLVYKRLIARISSVKAAIYRKFFEKTFFISKHLFYDIQYFDIN